MASRPYSSLIISYKDLQDSEKLLTQSYDLLQQKGIDKNQQREDA